MVDNGVGWMVVKMMVRMVVMMGIVGNDGVDSVCGF